MFRKETQVFAGQYQVGDSLLVVSGGVAMQFQLAGYLHVGRVMANANVAVVTHNFRRECLTARVVQRVSWGAVEIHLLVEQ